MLFIRNIHWNINLGINITYKKKTHRFLPNKYRKLSSFAFWGLWIVETNMWMPTLLKNHKQNCTGGFKPPHLVTFSWDCLVCVFGPISLKTHGNVSKGHTFFYLVKLDSPRSKHFEANEFISLNPKRSDLYEAVCRTINLVLFDLLVKMAWLLSYDFWLVILLTMWLLGWVNRFFII